MAARRPLQRPDQFPGKIWRRTRLLSRRLEIRSRLKATSADAQEDVYPQRG